MIPEQQTECRYFVSYSGIKLPLKLVNEITETSLYSALKKTRFFHGLSAGLVKITAYYLQRVVRFLVWHDKK